VAKRLTVSRPLQAVGGHHLEPADIDDILIGPDA
jgi:hypothetical protein